jgi:uncharacterized protein
MTESGFRQLKADILQKLREGLDPRLTYHSDAHTIDVLHQAERIAISEKISDNRLLLLIKIASLFHDTGFLRAYRGHEEKSCEILVETLDPKMFDLGEFTIIRGMIMATKLPQTARTLPEKIICDADLDYLGRDDFETIGSGLRQEFFNYKVITTEEEWDRLQVHFFENHRYFTTTSIHNRCPLKTGHLQQLKEKLLKYNP